MPLALSLPYLTIKFSLDFLINQTTPRIKIMLEMEVEGEVMQFEDYFPSMMEGLGADAFMEELFQGFNQLMDEEKGLITFESLRRSTLQLGLQEIGDEELMWMLSEGDLDGDGALDQTEFCMLMLGLSPGLNGGTEQFHRPEEMCMNEMEGILGFS